MLRRRLLLLTCVGAMTLGTMLAQAPETTLTMSVTGTLGPVLQGTDPKGIDGHTGTLTVKISESASPAVSNTDYAAYVVPAGGVTAMIGTTPYTTESPSRMAIKLGANGDTISVVFRSQDNTESRFEAELAPGSFSTSVLMHPTPFSPSPQNLTPATSAAGPGSQFWYREGTAFTVLGLTGSISNSAAQAPNLGQE